MEKLRQKLLEFITSEKDVPLLAGFCVGFYFIILYYSRNFDAANSWFQFGCFVAYYFLMPMTMLFFGCLLLKILGISKFIRNWLFVGIVVFFAGFMLQISKGSFFTPLTGICIAAAILASIWLRNYYKALIPALLFMSLFNMKPLAGIAYATISNNDDWRVIHDGIEHVTFKQKPNIYYIQPDGYTSFKNLRENKYYHFDNSDYEQFLKENGFTVYEDYHSNYNTTLLSNASMFSMKQHFVQPDVKKFAARGIIASNPVLKILKRNGYKNSFITEAPYLIINRPSTDYDYCNISYNDIPFFGDGFASWKGEDVFGDLKKQMKSNKPSGNFYFIENFLPGHIAGSTHGTDAAQIEAIAHMKYLGMAKRWLKEVVSYINANDPNALIIIAADHGGYVGFNNTQESLVKTSDKDLIRSMYGAQLAIKWDGNAAGYDRNLKSSVNLFRSVFSFFSNDKKYLDATEDNSSYIELSQPKGVYRYIDDNGIFVFEKK